MVTMIYQRVTGILQGGERTGLSGGSTAEQQAAYSQRIPRMRCIARTTFARFVPSSNEDPRATAS